MRCWSCKEVAAIVRKNEKGQITVYLSLILMAVIVLAGVLIDAARIFSAETQVSRAVSASARSVLAGYSTRLKDEYGLFMLGENGKDALREKMKEYLSRTLGISPVNSEAKGKQINLYDFRVEKIIVTPIYNGTENEVVRGQVLEYMKYRAPREIAEGVWEKIKSFKAAGKMSEAYKRKTEVDSLAGKTAEIQEALKTKMDGVNAFNKDGSRYALTETFAGLAVEYRNLMSSLSDADPTEIEGLLESAMQVRDSLERIGNNIRTEKTAAYLKPIDEAIEKLGETIRLGKEINEGITGLVDYMGEGFAEDETQPMTQNFKTALQADMDKITGLLPGEQEAMEMIEGLHENSRYLKDALSNFDRIQSGASSGSLSREQIVQGLNKGLEGYNRFNYSYEKVEKVSGLKDPRKSIESDAKEKVGKREDADVNFETGSIDPDLLPSRHKIESGAPSTVGKQDTVEYEGDLKNLRNEISFQNKEAGFTEKAFGFISSAGSILAGTLTDLRDEIYVDEYILHTFKSAVPVPPQSQDAAMEEEAGKQPPRVRQSFFDCEVEYILHGNSSQAANKLMTQGQILLIRFGLDTLHVYTDPRKRALAESTAAAAGVVTAGLGIPIVSNLIMCSWGMGEALLDMELLMGGKEVPLYKSGQDWLLDIGLEKVPGTDPAGRLNFSYNDYLRLLLLLENPEEKMGRIEDLIQVNVGKETEGFTMGAANSWLKIEAEVSMNYLFMTQAFMPADLKTPGGRHKFNVVIYEGY